MATPVHYTTPEEGLITQRTMEGALVREVEFVELFKDDVRKLTEALGVTRKLPVTAGTTLKVLKAQGSLGDGEVPEGQLIPLSNYAVDAEAVGEINLMKHRKATSAESIVRFGFEQAVVMTTDKMRKDVQKLIRQYFYGSLADFATKVKYVGETGNFDLQTALASLWGGLQIKYEDTSIEGVYFANPMDVADYLASAQISTQTAFGMSYVENFLGIGTLILSSDVDVGSVYATAKENLVLYYIPVNGADLGNAFNFTADETGLIGIHEEPDYKTMTAEDVVVYGISLFVERADGVLMTDGTQPDGSAS